LDVLVEAHDEHEMEAAAEVGANFIGINNRDLRTFETDLRTTERLVRYAPENALLVSESAIWSHGDVVQIAEWGAKAVLVGESLERQDDIAQAVRDLMGFRHS
jgi:indole-3-glycerol phosphate synthase